MCDLIEKIVNLGTLPGMLHHMCDYVHSSFLCCLIKKITDLSTIILFFVAVLKLLLSMMVSDLDDLIMSRGIHIVLTVVTLTTYYDVMVTT